jgi:hypothetical protein
MAYIYFKAKNPNLGKFWAVLQWKMWIYYAYLVYFYDYLVYFMAIWYILWPFGIFYCHLVYFTAIWYILLPFGNIFGHLVYLWVIWYIFYRFGILCQEKSGNPGLQSYRK